MWQFVTCSSFIDQSHKLFCACFCMLSKLFCKYLMSGINVSILYVTCLDSLSNVSSEYYWFLMQVALLICLGCLRNKYCVQSHYDFKQCLVEFGFRPLPGTVCILSIILKKKNFSVHLYINRENVNEWPLI